MIFFLPDNCQDSGWSWSLVATASCSEKCNSGTGCVCCAASGCTHENARSWSSCSWRWIKKDWILYFTVWFQMSWKAAARVLTKWRKKMVREGKKKKCFVVHKNLWEDGDDLMPWSHPSPFLEVALGSGSIPQISWVVLYAFSWNSSVSSPFLAKSDVASSSATAAPASSESKTLKVDFAKISSSYGTDVFDWRKFVFHCLKVCRSTI